MLHVEKRIVIERPVEEVFAFVTDISQMPRWAVGIDDARQTSPGPVGVGTTAVQTVELLGQHLRLTCEVKEYDPPHTYVLATRMGPFPFVGRSSLRPLDGGTELISTTDGQPRGLFSLMEPILRGTVAKQTEVSLGRLKRLLESEPR